MAQAAGFLSSAPNLLVGRGALRRLPRRRPRARLERSSLRLLSSASDANPVTLTSRSCTVHLLGTMHIAQSSAAAAKSLIEREHAAGRLASIFLELDDERYARLLKTPDTPPDESLLEHALSILKHAQSVMSRPGRSPIASLFELGLGTLYRTLHRLGFASGVEFRAAISAAEKLGGVPVVLGDQHIQVTLARIAAAAPRDFSVANALAMLTGTSTGSESVAERTMRDVFQDVTAGRFEEGQRKLERLVDRQSARELVEPMREVAPNVTAAILDERDGVMSANLVKEANKHPGKSVVAVVGMAHVDGIVSRWDVIAG